METLNDLLPSPLILVVITIAICITAGSTYYAWWYVPNKLSEAYRKSLYTIAAAVETKDSGTIGHAQRVAGYTVAIARELGVRGSELLCIEHAAVLRDIGKVNLPQALLNKSTSLTPEEWERLKSHSQLGAEIVRAVPFIADTANLILYHHEAWDGSGYPDGLAGEEIPLGSRILAVATDFDAATSDRPYHNARPVAQALEEIQMGSGTRYDPRVVEVFMHIIKRENGQA